MLSIKVLLTGGAGCIGSNMVKRLFEDGREVVTLDNLPSTAQADAVTGGEFVKGDPAFLQTAVQSKDSLAPRR